MPRREMADLAKRAEYLAGLLKGLTAFSDTLTADSGKGFADGFAALKGAGVGHTSLAAQDAENVHKNRYRNVPGENMLSALRPIQPAVRN